jgi:Tol biopolymer transport system component
MLQLEQGAQPIAFLQSRFNESQGQFSPNGKWFAYVSDQSGQPQIYVTSFPTPGGREQVSTAGGVQPRWRPDGRELFYLAPDGNLMAIAVQPADTLIAETPRVLFNTSLQRDALRQTYAVSSDGERFLLQVPVETSSSVTVVLDWPALLSP